MPVGAGNPALSDLIRWRELVLSGFVIVGCLDVIAQTRKMVYDLGVQDVTISLSCAESESWCPSADQRAFGVKGNAPVPEPVALQCATLEPKHEKQPEMWVMVQVPKVCRDVPSAKETN